MHIINSIGKEIDTKSAKLMVDNLCSVEAISRECAALMNSAVADRNFAGLAKSLQDTVRAAILKNMLLTQI